MNFPTRWLVLLAWLTLALPTVAEEVPAHLREAAKNLSKSYTINYDETRKIVFNLPDGYLVRREPGFANDIILCPWNEFFTINSAQLPARTGKPVLSEASLNLELDALQKAHQTDTQGGEVKNRKVWVTPKGPMASMETWAEVEKKVSVTSFLIYPVGSSIWIFSLTGYDSALADQKVIQNLLITELSK